MLTRNILKQRSMVLNGKRLFNMMNPSLSPGIDFENKLQHWETQNRTSLQFTLTESPGVLNKALNILTSNKVNMTRIQSKPSKFFESEWREVDFFIDVDCSNNDPRYTKAVEQLKLIAERVQEVGTPEVPWFPTRIEDFDFIGKRTLTEGEGI